MAATAFLRELRVTKGISQNMLAQMSGLSRTGLGHIESGSVLPSFANVLRISKALGVTITEMMRSIGAE